MGRKSVGYKSWQWAEISSLPDKELRQAYTELRDIAQKRIKRGGGLPGSGPGRSGESFPKLKELEPSQVKAQLKKLHAFVANPFTKKSEQSKKEKAKAAKAKVTMERNGYDTKLIGDLEKFGKYMEQMRLRMQTRGKNYRSSDQWAKLYEQAERLQISQEDLNKHYRSYLNNLEKLEAAPVKKNGQGYSHGQLRNLFYGKKKR